MRRQRIFVRFKTRLGQEGEREFTGRSISTEGHDLVVRDEAGSEIERFSYDQYEGWRVELDMDGERVVTDFDVRV